MEIFELTRKAKKGDGNAFSKLVKLYERDLYRVAISILKHEDDALDSIQDTILSAYNNIKSLSGEEYFKTWIIRILINKCKDSLKKRGRVPNHEGLPPYTGESLIIERLDIKHALEHMGDELRIIVILYYFEDMSIRAIADCLSIPEGTVKSRLSRAREKLKVLLNYDDEGVM